MSKKIVLILIVLFGAVDTAFGYVGPGAGLSLLGALWGLLLAVGAAFGFVLLWPIRKVLKRIRAGKAGETQEHPTKE